MSGSGDNGADDGDNDRRRRCRGGRGIPGRGIPGVAKDAPRYKAPATHNHGGRLSASSSLSSALSSAVSPCFFVEQGVQADIQADIQAKVQTGAALDVYIDRFLDEDATAEALPLLPPPCAPPTTADAATATRVSMQHIGEMMWIAARSSEVATGAPPSSSSAAAAARCSQADVDHWKSRHRVVSAERDGLLAKIAALEEQLAGAHIGRNGCVQSSHTTLGCIKIYARNYYDLFDLPSDATESEIRSRFKWMQILVHPDKNPRRVREATRLLTAIKFGLDLLTGKTARAKYNRLLRSKIVTPHGGVNTDIEALRACVFTGLADNYYPREAYVVTPNLLGSASSYDIVELPPPPPSSGDDNGGGNDPERPTQ